MANEVTITGANFDGEVLGSPLPVLLDFWAPWCAPCRMLAPILEEVADEYAGRVKVGKINVDDESDLAAKHGVVSIPSLVVYKEGKIVRQESGARPKHELENLFKDLI